LLFGFVLFVCLFVCLFVLLFSSFFHFPWLGKPLRNSCVTNDYIYVSFHKRNMTNATSGVEIVILSGAHEFTSCLVGFKLVNINFLCSVLLINDCPFFLAILLSVLPRFTVFDYQFGIFYFFFLSICS
jgi:hypothetical protein